MRFCRQITICGYLGCVVVLLLLRWETKQVRKVRAELVSLQKLTAEARLEARRSHDRLAALQTRPVPNPASRSDPEPAAKQAAADTAAELRRQAARDHAKIDLEFFPLYRALHLTREESAQVTALFAAFQIHRGDILEAAKDQGLTRENPAIAEMIRQQADGIETALSGILGPDGFIQWLDYRQNQSVRDLEQNLAADMYDTATPLTPIQSAQLTPLLAQLRRDDSERHGGFDLLNVDSARIRNLAAPFLSGPQMEKLDALLSDNQVSQQLALAVAQWRRTNAVVTAINP